MKLSVQDGTALISAFYLGYVPYGAVFSLYDDHVDNRSGRIVIAAHNICKTQGTFDGISLRFL